ncbi:MAG: histone [Parachlamydiales bacterium]|nr:histone [Parachlamydiales bacterium]
MVLKNTVKSLQALLEAVTHDLQKADHGNKAASQRVRTGTIRLEKVAKMYRKESISEDKKSKGRKPAKAKAKSAAKPAKAKKAAPKKAKPAKKAAKKR